MYLPFQFCKEKHKKWVIISKQTEFWKNWLGEGSTKIFLKSLITKDTKSYQIKGCYNWDLSHLNLAPFLFVLITFEPIISIETSISANHNLLFFDIKRQIQIGLVPVIASLDLIGFRIFNTVWKNRNFTFTQILREIIFGVFRSSKSAIFAFLEALNFELKKSLRFYMAETHQFQNSETEKMAYLELLIA